MKFLTDENIGLEVVESLRAAGHDVNSVIETIRGAEDVEILEKANRENRILITADKDFGNLIHQHKLPHKGIILLRLTDEKNRNKIRVLSSLLETYEKELKNRFVVVTEDRVRIRQR